MCNVSAVRQVLIQPASIQPAGALGGPAATSQSTPPGTAQALPPELMTALVDIDARIAQRVERFPNERSSLLEIRRSVFGIAEQAAQQGQVDPFQVLGINLQLARIDSLAGGGNGSAELTLLLEVAKATQDSKATGIYNAATVSRLGIQAAALQVPGGAQAVAPIVAELRQMESAGMLSAPALMRLGLEAHLLLNPASNSAQAQSLVAELRSMEQGGSFSAVRLAQISEEIVAIEGQQR